MWPCREVTSSSWSTEQGFEKQSQLPVAPASFFFLKKLKRAYLSILSVTLDCSTLPFAQQSFSTLGLLQHSSTWASSSSTSTHSQLSSWVHRGSLFGQTPAGFRGLCSTWIDVTIVIHSLKPHPVRPCLQVPAALPGNKMVSNLLIFKDHSSLGTSSSYPSLYPHTASWRRQAFMICCGHSVPFQQATNRISDLVSPHVILKRQRVRTEQMEGYNGTGRAHPAQHPISNCDWIESQGNRTAKTSKQQYFGLATP